MTDKPRQLLVIAPHPDDETIGCGATMARLSSEGWGVTVLTVAAHMPPHYPSSALETTLKEQALAHAILGVNNALFLEIPALEVDRQSAAELNNAIKTVVEDLKPTVVLIPFLDRHDDHVATFKAAMVATRPLGNAAHIKCVASYETTSESHWNASGIEPQFQPNWFVNAAETIGTKLDALRAYQSQLHPFPGPRSIEAVDALACFRGSQVGVGRAEAFQIVRQIDWIAMNRDENKTRTSK